MPKSTGGDVRKLMKINNLQNYNIQKPQPTFGAGVTNLYSDFDGTYMPYEWKHDAFCKYDSPERAALLQDKKSFQDYFDDFAKVFKIAKSPKGDKFNCKQNEFKFRLAQGV